MFWEPGVEPTAEQRRLLETIGSIFLEHHRWPNWAYVDEVLEREGLAADAVLMSMPRDPTFNYSFVSWPFARPPQPANDVKLTIAGFRHLEAASVLVADRCALIGTLGAIRANVQLDPFDTGWPRTTMKEVSTRLYASHRMPPVPITKARMEFLSEEPATWRCQLLEDLTEDWVVELAPQVRRFADLRDVDDFLERLGSMMAEARQPSEAPVLASPFTLPAAFDYLDTVWQLKFGKPLIVPPGLERSARLVLDVATAEEADTALSALAEVLKNLNVPGVEGIGGHPLQRLVSYLATQLPEEAMPTVSEAVSILDAARQVRASFQHVGVQPRAVNAFTDLGLTYPVADWPSAWGQIQAVVAHACDRLRQELHSTFST